MKNASKDRKMVREFFARQQGDTYDDDGSMVQVTMAKLRELADEIDAAVKPGTDLPAWVVDKLATVSDRLEVVRDYLKFGVEGEIGREDE